MKEKERLLKSIEWDRTMIERRVERLNALPIDLISEAFPDGSWCPTWGYEYEFTLPMRFELIGKFEEFCKLQGYEIKHARRHVWDDKNAGDFMDVYVNESISFVAAFRSTKEGSTCVISKIGEEMKPIFEVICSEGAKEGAL